MSTIAKPCGNDIENRVREDISHSERRLRYRQWLRAGFFRNQADLAKHTPAAGRPLHAGGHRRSSRWRDRRPGFKIAAPLLAGRTPAVAGAGEASFTAATPDTADGVARVLAEQRRERTYVL